MVLPPRLMALARQIEPGWRVADIGTDHAMLPLYLVGKGISPHVIATDVASGPLERAGALIARHGLEERIELRRGWGLRPLSAGEVDCVVIAGMGGGTIGEIIEDGLDKTKRGSSLILMPAQRAADLRKKVYPGPWKLLRESLVEDQGRLYELMVVSRSDGSSAGDPGEFWYSYFAEPSEEVLYGIGPLLFEQRDPLLAKFVDRKVETYRRALAQAGRGPAGELLKRTLEQLEVLKNWLASRK